MVYSFSIFRLSLLCESWKFGRLRRKTRQYWVHRFDGMKGRMITNVLVVRETLIRRIDL